ncbi:sigma-70 family RNA polymerase sigma factor, partial [bacterium]|nr:sigma-70 family RNA polymerase sigma factor [bacterium]MCK4437358.1 sigma-70 family RNA polymerase sigma factor [bacterium]
NRLRGKRRHPVVSLDSLVETEEGKVLRDIPAPAQARPDVLLERKELQKLIKESIDSLPPKQRMVVVLAKYDNLPYREIARVMGCSVTAVKLRLHRAKVTLKARLAPYLEKK